MSILPDLDEKILPGFDEKGSNWIAIDSINLKNKIISNNKIRNLIFNWKTENKPENKTLNYKFIKKVNGQYYVAKVCLTEFFSISKLKLPLIISFGTINTDQEKGDY